MEVRLAMWVRGKQPEARLRRGPIYLVTLLALILLAGPALKGGVAQPSESGYFVKQDNFFHRVNPLTEARSAPAFYNYFDYQANTNLVSPNHSLLFLYRDMNSGVLSLFIIHDAPDDGTDGSATFSFAGLPENAEYALMDDTDGSDEFSLDPPNGKVSWYWYSEHTDGLVVSGIGDNFEITIRPSFLWGIESWDVLTGDVHSPARVPLPSLTEPLTIVSQNNTPRAWFVFSPPHPCVHEPVTFDASASEDPDGQVVSYEWDFNGDGLFERRVDSPIVENSFDHASISRVTLRVRDNLGAVGVASREIEIDDEVISVTRTISTPLPDHQTLLGGTFKVTVTIQAYGEVIGLGLEERVPGNWEVSSIGTDKAQFKSSSLQWAFVDAIRGGERKEITYQVRVPQSEMPGTFKIDGTLVATLPNLEIPVKGDSQVSVTRFLPIRVAISRLDAESGEIDITLSNIISFPQIQLAIALWLEERPVPGTNGKLIDLRTMLELITYWLTDTPVDRPVRR
jgi:PKD repeat protein